MDIRRGSVWWWTCPNHLRTHIQAGTRPVLVVSNDVCNSSSNVITVVPLTTHAKQPYPQQMPLILNGQVSVALADQITSIPVDELGDYIGLLKDFQIDLVDRAIAVQLGFIDVRDNCYSLFPDKSGGADSWRS